MKTVASVFQPPDSGVSIVNPKGMSSEPPDVISSTAAIASTPNASEVVLDDMVKKSVKCVAMDQVMVGGGSISISELVARIQAELMAKLANDQVVRIAEQPETEKTSKEVKSVSEQGTVSESVPASVVKKVVQAAVPSTEMESASEKIEDNTQPDPTVEMVVEPLVQEEAEIMHVAEEEALPGNDAAQHEEDEDTDDIFKSESDPAQIVSGRKSSEREEISRGASGSSQ